MVVDGARSDPRTAAPAERLRRWRERSGGRGRRLPRFAWEGAVPPAREYGVEAVARALRVRAAALAREAMDAEVEDAMREAARPSAAFLELGPMISAAGATVEIEGAKTTIRLPPGAPWSAVAEIARELLGVRP